ncbi:hypothetical protein L209DRAFT_415155 [Thermothelomyces heterothallicus CBS 203.75]
MVQGGGGPRRSEHPIGCQIRLIISFPSGGGMGKRLSRDKQRESVWRYHAQFTMHVKVVGRTRSKAALAACGQFALHSMREVLLGTCLGLILALFHSGCLVR